MKAAVYSGTFAPMHIGHLSILDFIVREKLFDKVYLVVSPRNPFKDSSLTESAEERLAAAREAIGRHPELKNVVVSDMEFHMPPPSYTIRTLDLMKEKEPDNDFTLIIGADNLASMLKWKEGARILTEYGVAVYPRKGFDSEELRDNLLEVNPDFRIMLLDAPLADVSSTEIRKGMAEGRDMSALLM